MPHLYKVQRNDSALKIAIAMTGCPKCTRALVDANPHKATITFPNGFKTFRELTPGETLNLPDHWMTGKKMPDSYYDALPWPPGWDENWKKHYRG